MSGNFSLASYFECEVLSFDLYQQEILVKLKLLFFSGTSVERVCGLGLKSIDHAKTKQALDRFFENTNRGFCKLYIWNQGNRTLFYCDLYDVTNRNINQYLINNNLAEDFVQELEEELLFH